MKEQGERYIPTDVQDAAQYKAAMKHQEKRIVVGEGLPKITVLEGETVIGSNGVIHQPETKTPELDYRFDDPKFNGQGGKFPGFDR